jgi:hypothetical protein
MIKNWLVKVRQIRQSGIKRKYKKVTNENGRTVYKKIEGSGRRIKNGFVNHVNYLKDGSRAAHRNTKITVLLNNTANILKAINERKAFRQAEKLGHATVFNYCTSFVVSLPSELKPTLDDWTQISKRIIKDVAGVTGISISKIAKHTHIVLHDESASPDKHSHIHVLVSNVIDNDVVKVISQRVTISTIKKGVNASVKQHLGVDNTKYTPQNSKVVDKPLWLARQEKNTLLQNNAKKLDEEINQKKIKLLKVNKVIALLAKKLLSIKIDISVWAGDFLNNYFAQAEEKAESVAKLIDDIDLIAGEQAVELEKIVRKVENRNKSAPPEAKISPKRKRRRRKNKKT